MSERQCYGCFTQATFHRHGSSERYFTELSRYHAGLESPIVDCPTCERLVRYTEKNGRWREEAVE